MITTKKLKFKLFVLFALMAFLLIKPLNVEASINIRDGAADEDLISLKEMYEYSGDTSILNLILEIADGGGFSAEVEQQARAYVDEQYNKPETTTPTSTPEAVPTSEPTATPTAEPTITPTPMPITAPTATAKPTVAPTQEPIIIHTPAPTVIPTPTIIPVNTPTTNNNMIYFILAGILALIIIVISIIVAVIKSKKKWR